ncbi:MAG TPA: trypsin-like peptidase domain-containing protein [Vicinamibacterales bacterium]|nr:trypsin-like peptidase domain-containing protein [Vicinamibacterales bacterium]
MSTGKTSAFYAVLIAVAGMAVGLVIASRLDLAPASSAQTVAVPATNSAPLSGPIDATTFRNIARINGPAVVNIQTEVRQRSRDLTDYFGGGGGGGDDLLRRFFGGDEPQAPAPRGRNRAPNGRNNEAPVLEGAGTGFIVSRSGLILTNNHVIEGAQTIRVSFEDEVRAETFLARVVGHDVLTDTALLQLTEMPPQPLTEMKFGDSDQMQPGDWVMAIGNPFRLGHSVSVGVISALGRPFGVSQREQPMLQTDAAINPGNSGGPLLNVRGEVIGMNTAIYTDQRSANIGIGFATPINAIRDLLPQLQNGKVVRGVIGVTVAKDRLSAETAKAFGLPSTGGALISSVSPNRPADKAGIIPGDVVVEFNGKPVKDSDSLVGMVVATKPGTSVPVVIYRSNQRKTMNVTIDELDLEAEQNLSARRGTPNGAEPAPSVVSPGFGMTLDPITPEIARRIELPPNGGGAIVTDVDRNSPAARGGVIPGDVILEVNRQKVANMSQVTRELQKVQNGQVAFLLIWRDGNNQFVTMTKR